jgi:hypothetical protein
MLCEQSTTSNGGPDQISTESDELIVTASGIGVRGVGDNFNFLPSDHLPWPFLHHWHFFVDPRLLGLVLIPRCWASVFDTTGWQWPPLLSFRTQGSTLEARLLFLVSHAGHHRGTRHHHAIGLEPYRVIKSFILRGISKSYPFTSDGSAGHCLKLPNFGLANSQIFLQERPAAWNGVGCSG